ncbi:MAG: hypothetical protein JJT93_11895 [Gammaproteobacteria bacterium]|nr:hypothetical protein [Gammaproteobacteria bacterium]
MNRTTGCLVATLVWLVMLPTTSWSTQQLDGSLDTWSIAPDLFFHGLGTGNLSMMLAPIPIDDIPEMEVTAPWPDQSLDEITQTMNLLQWVLALDPAHSLFGVEPQWAHMNIEPISLPTNNDQLAACLDGVEGTLANCLRNARLNHAGCITSSGLVLHIAGRLLAAAVCTGIHEWETSRCSHSARAGRSQCEIAMG